MENFHILVLPLNATIIVLGTSSRHEFLSIQLNANIWEVMILLPLKMQLSLLTMVCWVRSLRLLITTLTWTHRRLLSLKNHPNCRLHPLIQARLPDRELWTLRHYVLGAKSKCRGNQKISKLSRPHNHVAHMCLWPCPKCSRFTRVEGAHE